MRILAQGTEMIGRALQENAEACPPGYERFNEQSARIATIAVACISAALLLGGTGSCVVGCCKRADFAKKVIPFCCGSVMILAGLATGIAAAVTSLNWIIHNDGDCVAIPPPPSSGN